MATEAVIFDFDGVILDSFVVLPVVYKILTKELNLNIPDHVLESGDFFKVDWKDNLKQLGLTSQQEIQKSVEIYHREYAKLEHHIMPFKGIKAALEALSKQYKLAIVSSSYVETIESMLIKFELRGYFDCIIGADHGMLKPDPTPFFMCLDFLKVKPEVAVYIGDMDEDVLAARNAKLKKAIAVTYGFHSETRLAKARPDLIISKPEEILEAVK